MPRNTKSPRSARPGDSRAEHPAGRSTASDRPAPDAAITADRIEAAQALDRHRRVAIDAHVEWLARSEAAAGMVRAGTWTEQDRARNLRPWLAIACLCDVDMPHVTQAIAPHHTIDLADPADPGLTYAQAVLRAADAICPEKVWREALRDAVARVSDAITRDGSTPATSAQLKRLARLTGPLGVRLPPIPRGESLQEAA